MQTNQLGNSDLHITPIGLGAWAIGGKWQWGWGEQDDQASIETIHHALGQGINWIDTAPVYGLGHSEEVVGKAINGMSEKPLIFTKCCFTWDTQGEITPSLKAAKIREEIEASLKRLNIETIDLYQIHWPNPKKEIEEGWTEMANLVKEGKIRYLGVSNHNVEQMQKLEKIAHISSLQPPYSLLNRDYEEEVLPWCKNNGTGVICYSPMASGMLTGKMTRERIASLQDDWRKEAPDFTEPKLTRNLKVVEKLQAVANAHGRKVTEIALAWVLKNSAVTGAITGMRSPEQVDDLVGASEVNLTKEDIELIESV